VHPLSRPLIPRRCSTQRRWRRERGRYSPSESPSGRVSCAGSVRHRGRAAAKRMHWLESARAARSRTASSIQPRKTGTAASYCRDHTLADNAFGEDCGPQVRSHLHTRLVASAGAHLPSEATQALDVGEVAASQGIENPVKLRRVLVEERQQQVLLGTEVPVKGALLTSARRRCRRRSTRYTPCDRRNRQPASMSC